MGRTLQIACLMARIEIGHFPRIGRGAPFDRADRIGVRLGEAYLNKFLDRGKGPSLGLYAAWALYDLLVYRRIRKELGGRMRYAVSGGSPLDRNLNLFFYVAGIIVYEGYGLTESTAAATIVPPLKPRLGTVGLPVPGTAIRIADDGEVLSKGGVVFGAYWNDSAATDAALTDEWFATGDLGALDADGYLTITGRKKDILVTSGGKNVSPAVLEDRLRSRAPVEAVSRAESIRAFTLVEGEFNEESGLLTPSLKVKRHAVTAAYADEIETLWRR